MKKTYIQPLFEATNIQEEIILAASEFSLTPDVHTEPSDFGAKFDDGASFDIEVGQE